MRRAIDILRLEPSARAFFAALAQSALGTGAGYVALLLVAYERLSSPWAIGLVLMADFVPSMLLGPLFGALVDRWSRRRCMVLADVVRACAFVALGLVDGFAATLALALVAGAGTALFRPAALAALPGLVSEGRTAPATSLFSATTDLGYTVGPAVAALALLAGTAEQLLVANGITFAVSAVVLGRVRFRRTPSAQQADGGARRGLLAETRDGVSATAGMTGIRVVLAASAAALMFGGLFNVAELLFAQDELEVGDAGYSLLVTLYGLGFVLGSLAIGADEAAARLKRRYLAGVLVLGLGSLASGPAPTLVVALATFAAAGFGNGMLVVHERLLIQSQVDSALQGRVFAVGDALVSWGFALAFAGAGAVASALGPRVMMAAAGAGVIGVWAVAALALRGRWRVRAAPLGSGAEPLRQLGAGQ